MKCVNCGSENAKDAIFCAFCGEKLQQNAYCRFCGQKLDENASFCPSCGASLTPAAENKTEMHRYNWLLAGVPALLLLVCLFLPWLSVPILNFAGDFFGDTSYTIFEVQDFSARLYEVTSSNSELQAFQAICTIVAVLAVIACSMLLLSFILKAQRQKVAMKSGIVSCAILFLIGTSILIGIAIVNAKVYSTLDTSVDLLKPAIGLWGIVLLSVVTGGCIACLWFKPGSGTQTAKIHEKHMRSRSGIARTILTLCYVVTGMLSLIYLNLILNNSFYFGAMSHIRDGVRTIDSVLYIFATCFFLMQLSLMLHVLRLHPYGATLLKTNGAHRYFSVCSAVCNGLQLLTFLIVCFYFFPNYFSHSLFIDMGFPLLLIFSPFVIFSIVLLTLACRDWLEDRRTVFQPEKAVQKRFLWQFIVPVLATAALLLIVCAVMCFTFDPYLQVYTKRFSVLGGCAPLFWCWALAFIVPAFADRRKYTLSVLSRPTFLITFLCNLGVTLLFLYSMFSSSDINQAFAQLYWGNPTGAPWKILVCLAQAAFVIWLCVFQIRKRKRFFSGGTPN